VLHHLASEGSPPFPSLPSLLLPLPLLLLLLLLSFLTAAESDRRLAVISEMVRIMRPGGRAMLQAWALEQEDTSRRKFHEQNVLVPWQLQQHFSLKSSPSSSSDSSSTSGVSPAVVSTQLPHEKESKTGTSQVTYQRFCHVYCEGELENLLSRVPNCRLIESGYDRSNWFICFEKI
jgi:hypothetical protein